MKCKITNEQKEIYQKMATETVGGAKLDDYEFLKSLLSVVIEYRHGRDGVKKVFECYGGVQMKSYRMVGKNMAQNVLSRCETILREWQNVGFFLKQDYLFMNRDKFPDMPKDFKESEEFGSLLTDEKIEKMNEDLQKILQNKV